METWLWIGVIAFTILTALGGAFTLLMIFFNGWYGSARSHAWVFVLFLTILFAVGVLLCTNGLAEKRIVVKIEASAQSR